jgi:uracil-DNA glycosylase
MPGEELARGRPGGNRTRSVDAAFERLLQEVRACAVCAAALPLGPRPLLRGRPSARLLIVSQAPGRRAHQSGLSFDDPSGDRLRLWLGLDRPAFYQESRVAIVPIGFCYPGRGASGGDLPPRPECAPLWHRRLIALLPDLELRLYVGRYALDFHLPQLRARPLADILAGWRDLPPGIGVLPHPSWRGALWAGRHPWFEAELLPALRARVAAALNPPPRSAPCRRR